MVLQWAFLQGVLIRRNRLHKTGLNGREHHGGTARPFRQTGPLENRGLPGAGSRNAWSNSLIQAQAANRDYIYIASLIWMQDGDSSSKDKSTIYLDGRSPEHQWESFDAYQEEFEHPMWKKRLQKEITGGHGGTDVMELRDFVDCIKRKTNTPIDVYDGAAWRAIAPLSEASVAIGSMPVDVPDFTNGKYQGVAALVSCVRGNVNNYVGKRRLSS